MLTLTTGDATKFREGSTSSGNVNADQSGVFCVRKDSNKVR